MKSLLIVIIFCLTICNISCAQIMKTVADAHKIKAEEQEFIGKPLSILLSEIKPPIKMFLQREGGGENANCLIFMFVDYNAYKEAIQNGKAVTSIRVYFKDNFVVAINNKTKGEKFAWTEEYAKKYGDYKILSLNVSGKD